MRYVAVVIIAALLMGAEKSAVQWTAKDTTGAEVAVPAAGKASVVAFLRVGQEQSADAIQQLASLQTSGQIVIVFSGENKPADVAKLIGTNKFPVVLDPDY